MEIGHADSPFTRRLFASRLCRHAYGLDPRRQISHDDAARADHGVISDFDVRLDDGADAEKNALAQLDTARKGRPRRHMHARAEHAIMIDRRQSVDDGEVSYAGFRVDNGSSHDDDSSPDPGGRRYRRRGMYDARQNETLLQESRADPHSETAVAQSDKNMAHAVGAHHVQLIIAADDFDAEHSGAAGIGIGAADRLEKSLRPDRFDDNFRMTARPDHDQRSRSGCRAFSHNATHRFPPD
nr:hypothetical protein [Methylosinus sporium]